MERKSVTLMMKPTVRNRSYPPLGVDDIVEIERKGYPKNSKRNFASDRRGAAKVCLIKIMN